jgi:uncharacterized protein with PIN domain
MAIANFRFYEELNDFLPLNRRKKTMPLTFDAPAPVRHLIETLGVPHTELEIILINGESVGFEQPVNDGDRVSVYPKFESLDVTPLLRLRPDPMRCPRFLADAHLGRLAGYLRMLGFDTLCPPHLDDGEMASQAAREHRILLTRDRALLMHRVVTHGCYVWQRFPRDQVRYLVGRLDLCGSIHPFSRCIRCNGVVEDVAKEAVAEELPARVREVCDEIRRCGDCRQLYWKGSHYERMCEFLESLC